MSNDRSPRDVCSITIGINGLIGAPLNFWRVDWSFQTATGRSPCCLKVTPQAVSLTLAPCCRGPQFRLLGWLFLFGCPDCLAGLSLLRRNPLDFLRDPVQGAGEAHGFALGLVGAGGAGL